MELDTIYNTDCLEGMKQIPDKSVDLGFTSPPYNRKRNDKYDFYDDCIDEYFVFLCEFTEHLLRVCKKNVFVNVQANMYNKNDVYKYIGKYSDKISNIIIWEKTNPMPCQNGQVVNAVEYFIAFGKLAPKERYFKNIITTGVNPNTDKSHKALMHPQVARKFIHNFSNEGDIVIDPFMGLATTAIACIREKRHFIGFELNKEYYEKAKKRIESEQRQLTLF